MAVQKRALLIGINRYKIPGADLRGCVNDVRNIQQVLMSYYGFTPESMTLLLDSDATRVRMQKEIQKLFKGAKPGDVLYLHFSGHGSNVEDTNGDEADRRDEILCPHDIDWKKPLTDDWLRIQIDKVKPGVNLTLVMDCCHSGTITRQFAPPDAPVINRYLPSPLDIAHEEMGDRHRGRLFRPRGLKAGKSKAISDTTVTNIPEVLFTGCRADQESADAYLSGSYNGALTYNLVKAIKQSKGKLTNRKLHELTINAIKKAKFNQTPQLEGNATNLDRQFLQSYAEA